MLAGEILKFRLGSEDRFTRFRLEPAIAAVGLELAHLEVIGENDREDAIDDPNPERGVFDGKHQLDAAAKVAWHPVCGGQEDLGLAVIQEVCDPRVLEVLVEDTDDADVFRDPGNARSKAADAADHQVDLDAGD